MGPRDRARRNLLIFWLVVIGLPILILSSCISLHISLSNMG
jgi:hypothetical protein